MPILGGIWVFERLMFRKVELWVVGLICVAAFVGVILVSAIARKTAHTAEGNKRFGLVGDAALALSMAPENLIRTGRSLINGVPISDVIRHLRNEDELIVDETRHAGKAGFRFSYPPGARPGAGYLLLSRYDGDDQRSYVELVDLNAQTVLHRWAPDIDAIWARSHLQSDYVNLARDKQLRRYLITHPYATEDGGLVFQGNASPLVKIDACSRVVWINDEDLFHHSIERDDSGMFWVATDQEPVTIKGVPKKFHDHSIAMVTPDGKLLMNRSVSQILIDNGLEHLVFGSFPDPIHLNDIEPVRKDGPYWRKGDLFLSLRSRSTVMLYRPSTNKVIWRKDGPWSKQHDVDILDDHRISIFNNNGREEYVASRTAEVNIYDFATGEVTSPWRAALERLGVWAGEQGLAEVLPNDELFVEEQPHGRLIRLTLDGDVVWEFVNRAKTGRVFMLNWSRLLDTTTGSRLAETLARIDCRGT
jgi:hypothetical protein